MTHEATGPWVGDQVYDEVAGKEGVITDVKGRTYILREVYSWALTWTSHDAKTLRVTVPRQKRIKRREER
ncbi:hypothetical protein ACF07W_28525 [Streptomyces sp. NPDC015140]|uniref:hypothetical protein n=1 Tax=Streptomyces sp. NPDC015140 TaxID=3364943 RepID=UPI0037000087